MIQQKPRTNPDMEIGALPNPPQVDYGSTRSLDEAHLASSIDSSPTSLFGISDLFRPLQSLSGRGLICMTLSVCFMFVAILMIYSVNSVNSVNQIHSIPIHKFDGDYGYGFELWSNPNQQNQTNQNNTGYMQVGGGPKCRDDVWYFAAVSDLDKLSKREKKEWFSYLKRGELSMSKHDNDTKWKMKWVDKEEGYELTSSLNLNGRGMELSDLVVFQERLMTIDDRTGVVYEVVNPWGGFPGAKQEKDGAPAVTPRYILADGSGETGVLKGFKGEWIAVKDGELYVGAHGKEATDKKDGYKIENKNPTWVKIIGRDNEIRHENWEDKYHKLREAVNTTFPGYIEHEAAAWSSIKKEWLFIPRHISHEKPYNEDANEYRGANIALFANEDFSKIRTLHLGNSDGTRLETTKGTKGFSSCAFVPNTDDKFVMTLRTIENEKKKIYDSFISIFCLETGKMVFEERHIGEGKYEGISFF